MKVIFRMAFVEGEVIKQKLRVSMQVLCSRTELALNVVKVVSPENQEMTGVLFRVHDVPDDWPWYEIELYGYMERTIQDLFVTPDKLLRAGQAEDRYTYTVKSMLGARESQLQKRGLLNCAEFAAMAKEATTIQKELEAQQAQDDIRRGSLSEGHSVKLEQQTASTLNDECGAAMPPPGKKARCSSGRAAAGSGQCSQGQGVGAKRRSSKDPIASIARGAQSVRSQRQGSVAGDHGLPSTASVLAFDGEDCEPGEEEVEDSIFSQFPCVEIMKGWNCGREFAKVCSGHTPIILLYHHYMVPVGRMGGNISGCVCVCLVWECGCECWCVCVWV